MARKDLLTSEEEKELGRRLPDPAAMQELVNRNLGLVRWVVSRYRVRPDHYDDLYQEGVIGLMRATETYNPDRPTKFSTMATWWIRAAVQRANARQVAADFCHAPRWGNNPAERDLPTFTPAALDDVPDLSDARSGPDDEVDARRRLLAAFEVLQDVLESYEGPGEIVVAVAHLRVFTDVPEASIQAIARDHGVSGGEIRRVENEIRARIGAAVVG